MIILNICLSDLDKEKITVSEKNGKKYLSIVCDERREPDKFGNTHSLSYNQSKEDRQNKVPKVYLAGSSGKEFKFNNAQATSNTATQVPTQQPNNFYTPSADVVDDLPF